MSWRRRCRYDFGFSPKWAAMASALSRWALLRIDRTGGWIRSDSAGLLSGELEINCPITTGVSTPTNCERTVARASEIRRCSTDCTHLARLSGGAKRPINSVSRGSGSAHGKTASSRFSCIQAVSRRSEAGAKLQVFRDAGFTTRTGSSAKASLSKTARLFRGEWFRVDALKWQRPLSPLLFAARPI